MVIRPGKPPGEISPGNLSEKIHLTLLTQSSRRRYHHHTAATCSGSPQQTEQGFLTMTTATICALYLRRGNQTCQMPARQFRKLVKELQAGRGQDQVMDLMMSGYDGFVGADGEVYCLDSLTLEMILA